MPMSQTLRSWRQED
jgi:hypothetical protein